MNNFFTDAVELLKDTLRDHAAEPVVYVSNHDQCTYPLQATRSDPDPVVDPNTGGVQLEHEDLDWRYCTSDIIHNGQIYRPHRGDLIRCENGEIYEVLPKGDDQCFGTVALGEITIVHTKRIH